MSAPEARVEHRREPCPDRILDDIGGAFGMGAVGGGLFHLVKGMRNAPRGQLFRGGLEAVRREAPRLGGSFAVWGGLFSTFDCTLVYMRQREDPWNSIMAGALTGGFLQLRAGPRAAAQSAAVGALILAMIEGLGIMLTKNLGPPPPAAVVQQQQQAAAAAAAAAAIAPTRVDMRPLSTAGGDAGLLLDDAHHSAQRSKAAGDDGSSSGGSSWLPSWLGGGSRKQTQQSSVSEPLDLHGLQPEPSFR